MGNVTLRYFEKGPEMAQKEPLGKILCEKGYLSRSQLEHALAEQQKHEHRKLGHILLELVNLGYKPKACVTMRPYTTSYNEEVFPAKALSEALGINHVFLDNGCLNFNNEVRNIELTK